MDWLDSSDCLSWVGQVHQTDQVDQVGQVDLFVRVYRVGLGGLIRFGWSLACCWLLLQAVVFHVFLMPWGAK